MDELHRIEAYLASHHVAYEVVTHEHAASSLAAAHLAHIDPKRLAKAVLLESDDCLLAAMVSADHEVSLGRLRDDFGERIHLADEATIRARFTDCDPGAIPGLTTAWGVDMVWEDDLLAQPDLYLETGDHTHLLHVETRTLKELLAGMPHCHFSKPRRMH
jgi:Ala-tRNA(Pro) deacylase